MNIVNCDLIGTVKFPFFFPITSPSGYKITVRGELADTVAVHIRNIDITFIVHRNPLHIAEIPGLLKRGPHPFKFVSLLTPARIR